MWRTAFLVQRSTAHFRTSRWPLGAVGAYLLATQRWLRIPSRWRFILRMTWVGSLATCSILIALALSTRTTVGDAMTYYAAAQRLNDGHQLYALTTGDIAIELRPPFWTVPLLSPPFIAVLWRPLEALGISGVFIWMGALSAGMMSAAVILFRRAPLAVALCAPRLGELSGAGKGFRVVFAAAVSPPVS